MSVSITINKDGSATLYRDGKKIRKGDRVSVLREVWEEAPVEKPKKEKPKSRVRRWEDAASRAMDALQELEEIRGEFEEWRDNLPENLQQSALGEKLDTVADLDIQSALEIVEEAAGADLPLGFGRD